MVPSSFLAAAKRALPDWAKRRLKAALGRGPHERPLSSVKFVLLRRTEPICRAYGFARGRPVDRYYIEAFLQAQSSHIKGRVLEIGDNSYTMAFGGSRVSRSDVLHVVPGHPGATFAGNLED